MNTVEEFWMTTYMIFFVILLIFGTWISVFAAGQGLEPGVELDNLPIGSYFIQLMPSLHIQLNKELGA